MEQSPMMSVPVAGGRQMEPLNWYFIAAACPVAVAALFFWLFIIEGVGVVCGVGRVVAG